ncbi:hypothetical protein MR657_10595, partial [bacterium]|nr:hypothetical protein [bacterium]
KTLAEYFFYCVVIHNKTLLQYHACRRQMICHNQNATTKSCFTTPLQYNQTLLSRPKKQPESKIFLKNPLYRNYLWLYNEKNKIRCDTKAGEKAGKTRCLQNA